MKKRCFPRYDTHIDARYCEEDANREWRACLVTKISRKGIGVIFYGDAPPQPGTTLQFELVTAHESGNVRLRGVLKWINRLNTSYAGGIELKEIVEETIWLQMIYYIRELAADKDIVDIKSMPEHKIAKTTLHPPPAKVIMSTKLDCIKNILNYKIL